MSRKQLEGATREVVRTIKTEVDLSDLNWMLKEIILENVLNTELGDHLG